MEWWLILILFLGALVVMFASGLPVAFAFMILTLGGALIYWGGLSGLHQYVLNMFSSVAKFTLLPIPMFVFLGELLFQSGIGSRMLDVLDKWLGRLPGRLSLITVGGSTVFSTLSGSTLATTAMMGSLMLPDMLRRGYKKPMSIGPIVGGGGLAMIIPPSALAVFLASVGDISVGKILIAGIIPGFIIASLYTTYVVGRCMLQPSLAPAYEVDPVPLSQKISETVKYVLPAFIIVLMILGFIFGGIATPTESAATGVLGAVILAACYRKLGREVVKRSILGALNITVMSFMIVVGAKTFNQIMVFSGATQGLIKLATGLPLHPILTVIAMQVTVLFMGCFLDVFGIIMMTLPLYLPVVKALGFDPVWFGILMLINIQMALSTPPFGILLFIMKGVAPPDIKMVDIYKACLPFLICDSIAMALCLTFPKLVTWLPNMMI
jgi:tripartite ATP-independent transporter DctM subunit